MIYQNIKRITFERKIPIYRIEDDLKFPRGSICKWNKNIPSVNKVKAVADYLKVDINELLKE